MSNNDERLSKVNANDRRVKRTKKLLRDSLFSLLQEKSINEITVTELTDVADINRATFYFYYTDILDMLSQIQDEAYELFEVVLQGADECATTPEAFVKYIENILMFCKQNSAIARFVITREYTNNKVLTKNDVIGYLDYFINNRKNQKNPDGSKKYQVAISRWKDDRDFIQHYKTGTYKEVRIQKIVTSK